MCTDKTVEKTEGGGWEGGEKRMKFPGTKNGANSAYAARTSYILRAHGILVHAPKETSLITEQHLHSKVVVNSVKLNSRTVPTNTGVFLWGL